MQAQNLCTEQRQRVMNSLTGARRQFTQSIAEGLRACRRDHTVAAFRHLSAANEVARIIVMQHGCRHANDLQRYTDTAILIRELLEASGMTSLVAPFLRGFFTDFENLFKTGQIDASALSYCRQLSEPDAIDSRLFFATLDVYADYRADCIDYLH